MLFGRQLFSGEGNEEKQKMNEELVACVKAMVDADARVSLQEIADCS